MKVSFGCNCGEVRGTIDNAELLYGEHFTCMCDDCQAYIHHIGRGADFLDENAGSDIAPVAPANLKFTAGAEKLKCVRLNPKGLHRFYAGCCKTPIANVMPPSFGYIGFACGIFPEPERTKVFGPVKARVMGKFGRGTMPADASPGITMKLVGSTFIGVSRMWFKGWRRPSPFFDSNSNQPVVRPYIIEPKERSALRSLCGPI